MAATDENPPVAGTILQRSIEYRVFIAGKGLSPMAWQQPATIPYCGPPLSPGSL